VKLKIRSGLALISLRTGATEVLMAFGGLNALIFLSFSANFRFRIVWTGLAAASAGF
jgi:hypothetical protein